MRGGWWRRCGPRGGSGRGVSGAARRPVGEPLAPGGPLGEADRAHRGALVLHHPVLLAGDAAVDQVAAAFRRIHAHRDLLR
ncbi:MAG: hypothetical protein U0736_28090 [Gemmataceae bacterium]